MKFSKIFSVCFAAGLALSGCSFFSASLDDKWFPADLVAPVGLPVYEVTPKTEHVPFFDTDEQIATVADLLEVDVEVVQASVDESLEFMEEDAQYVVIPISCDLPLESSLAAVSFLHPGYVWESTKIESNDFYAFGIDLAPGFDEVVNTASASWDVTGSFVSGVRAGDNGDDCSFSLMGFNYDFEVVGYTEVSRSAVDARRDIERTYGLIFGDRGDKEYEVDLEDYWSPARISFRMPAEALVQGWENMEPYLVHPVFYVGGDENFGGGLVYADQFAYAAVDPEVAAAEIRFLKS